MYKFLKNKSGALGSRLKLEKWRHSLPQLMFALVSKASISPCGRKKEIKNIVREQKVKERIW